MRKKPEYRAACGGDEWQMGFWGQSPQDAFSVKRYPAACGGVLHFPRKAPLVLLDVKRNEYYQSHKLCLHESSIPP